MRRRVLRIVFALLAAALIGGFFLLDVPSWQRLDLERLTTLPEATVLYDRNGEVLQTLYAAENRRSARAEQIPKRVSQAFVAIEDARFYSHHGLDVRRILGALLYNLKAGWGAQGGSTITQQLIKLTHLSGEKTLSRKAQEAYLALCLERRLSKEEILTAYLNTVYFGRGAYGIVSAADAYFGKAVDQLTLAEAALLAGIVKSPSGYAPHLNPERALERRGLVLAAMVESGFITEEEARAAQEELLVIRTDAVEAGTWCGDAILSEAAQALGVTADEIYTGGYRIESTIDAERQRLTDELFANAELFPLDAADGTRCEAAFVSVENATGAVLCLQGGREYTVLRGLNRATQARRQPGSTLKPISVYAAAIDLYGYTPISLLSDRSRTFEGGYAPSNAGGTEHGRVTLRQALSRSMNLATLDLADSIGVEAAYLYAKRLGVELSGADKNLSLAIGCMEKGATPLEVCGAYAALGNGGSYLQPYLIERICDAEGREVYRHEGHARTAVKETTASQLVSVLSTAAQEGTARALSGSGLSAVAGKTGTVSREEGGNQDIWTAAMTPREACTVWMGFDRTDGEHCLSEGTVGGGYPAQLAAAYLKAACAGEETQFPQPQSLQEVTLDRTALEEEGMALLASPNTPQSQTIRELLTASQTPTAVSDRWEPPETPQTFKVQAQPDGSALFSLVSLDRQVEYRLMCRRADGTVEQAASLQGERGAYLTWRAPASEKNASNIYWVEAAHRLRERLSLENAKAPATDEIVWPGGSLERNAGYSEGSEARTAPPPGEEPSLFAPDG